MIFCIVTPLLFDNFDIDYKKSSTTHFQPILVKKLDIYFLIPPFNTIKLYRYCKKCDYYLLTKLVTWYIMIGVEVQL